MCVEVSGMRTVYVCVEVSGMRTVYVCVCEVEGVRTGSGKE